MKEEIQELTIIFQALQKAPLSVMEAYAVNTALAKIKESLEDYIKLQENGEQQKEV